MGFLFRWIFRGVVIWAAVAMAQSCGNTQVFSDDVPVSPLPGAATGTRSGT